MKIINTSNEPYEFTYDGGHYGPIIPGQIVDYPDAMAHHAIKRSVVMFDGDDEQCGNPNYYRMQPLNEVDPKKVKEIAVFECPFRNTGCNIGPLKSMDELQAHLNSHFDFEMPDSKRQQSMASSRATK